VAGGNVSVVSAKWKTREQNQGALNLRKLCVLLNNYRLNTKLQHKGELNYNLVQRLFTYR